MEYIIGNAELLARISEVRAWKPFDERIVDFCNVLSVFLLKNPKTTKYPDLTTLAFWLASRRRTLRWSQVGMSGIPFLLMT